MSRQYFGLVDIPEGQIKDYKVEHRVYRTGEPQTLANRRCRLFGQKGGEVVPDKDYTAHLLTYDGGVWMTDLPCEIEQMYDCLTGIEGESVLVGGLGLGVAVHILLRQMNHRFASKVVVVEKSKAVIELVASSLPQDSRLEVVHDDLFKYLRKPGPCFTHAFYDIWQSDGEGTFFHTVLPLLRASTARVVNRPRCWNEDIMRGQLAMNLQSRMMFALQGSIGSDEYRQTVKEMTGHDLNAYPSIEQLATRRTGNRTRTSNIFWNWSVPFFKKVQAGKATADDILFYVRDYGVPTHWR